MLIAPKRLKIRTSNLAGMLPGIVPTWPLTNISEKWAWSRSRDPVNFGGLNADSSKTAEDMHFKFGWRVLRDSPDTIPTWLLTNVSNKWAWPRSRDLVNFWTLHANSSKMAEDTNFKFGRRVPRDSSDMTLTNVSKKWAWSRSRDPVHFWALNANSSKTAKGTNFKFERHVPGIVATWPLTKVSETLTWPGSRDRDNTTVPCKLQQWDRYRVPQNVFLLVLGWGL